MDLPLLSINEAAKEEKARREDLNKIRRDNYKYNAQLTKDIHPFRKRSVKIIKSTLKKSFRNDKSSRVKHYSTIKTQSSNEEFLLQNNSKQEINDLQLCNRNFILLQEKDLFTEPTDDFNFDGDPPYLSDDTDESGSTSSNDGNLDDFLVTSPERELHPYTHLSVKDATTQFLQMIRQSQISKKQSENLLSFIKSLLPVPNEMPKDMNTLFKQLHMTDYFTKTKICVLCQQVLSKNQSLCDECDETEKKYIAYIFDANVSSLLTKILSRLRFSIEEYKQVIANNNSETPYDIPFGKAYQNLLHQCPNENLLTLLLHVDGVSLVKSTKLKLWICDASFIELPPNLRTHRSNMILLSMYIGYSDPNVKTWLKSSFSNLNSLKTTAFHLDGFRQSYNLKVYGCIADSPALKLMANINGHTGYYPCFYCHLRGEHIRQARKRQYTYQSNTTHRTPNSFFLNSHKAELSNQKVLGHCGISILNDTVDIPLPYSLIIDYAHVTLLRHFKDVVTTVASSLAPTIRTNIDYSLRHQSFPHFFHRKLRGIADFSFIKATELKNLLLYGFIPHFMRYLTVNQLSFISLLIMGVRLIHGNDVFIPENGVIANSLLCRYYVDHHIYFQHQVNFVLHLHQHFQEIYELHGPLSSINTFAQEDFIGYLKKSRNGTTSLENLFSYYYNIDVLLKDLNGKIITHVNDGPIDLFTLSQEDSLFNELFSYHEKMCYCNSFHKCIQIYRRCVIAKKLYHSLHYIKRKNTNSYCIQYILHQGHLEFGAIKVFFQFRGQTFAWIEKFQIVNAFSHFLKDSHYYDLLKQSIDRFYFVIKKTKNTRLIPFGKIQNHLIIFENVIDEVSLATPISTASEHD